MVQDAEQDVALEDDQVRVEVLSNTTDIGSADKLTVGAGVTGGVVGVLPPPPPPPPQETNMKILTTVEKECKKFVFTITPFV